MGIGKACIIYLIFTLKNFPEVTSSLIDGKALSEELYKVADEALGVFRMQNVYDNLQYTTQPLQGSTLVTQITESLSGTFQRLILAVGGLKTTVEQEYGNFASTPPNIQECCQLTGHNYDPKFRANVTLAKACVTVPDDSHQTRKYPSKAVEQKMIDNYNKNPGLLWQYFAGEDGTYINYPAVKSTGCYNYDPRYRPFYASAATPIAKDVVIIIDTSGSMKLQINSKTLLQTAKEAAITVIQTLNSFDRVAVIGFSSDARTPTESCYQNQLALATEFTKTTLRNFINSLHGSGETNYEAPVRLAFSYLSNSKESIQGESRDQVILFLTDGENTIGGDPLDVIKHENQKLGNRAVIFTYGLGNALNPGALELLQKMANQASNNASYGEIRQGRFEHIQEPDKLRTAMASYYNGFSVQKENAEPIFSVPYLDLFSNTGLITSVCLPAYSGGNLIGVTCTDIKLTNLLMDITYFKQGELSYAFIIDGKGRTLMHPLLPLPRGAKQEPVIIDIHNLEMISSVDEVISAMKNGTTGDRELSAIRIYPRGVVLKEGIEVKSLTSHYYWKPEKLITLAAFNISIHLILSINLSGEKERVGHLPQEGTRQGYLATVPYSNFSLSIVVGSGDKQMELDNQPITGKEFAYHRLDIQPGSWKKCRHFARYATKEASSVMLTPGAFKRPYNYLDTEETQINITAYEKYFQPKSCPNPGLKDSVINSVAATYQAEEFWKSTQEGTMYSVWRYIGTHDGIMRTYPASQFPKDFDHKKRPWYRKTIAQKGPNILTAPYVDALGAGYILTMARKIYKGSQNGIHSESDQTEAVMGADMVIHHVYYLMLRKYNICRNNDYSCIIIDNSGFIIVHPDFMDNSITGQQIDDLHLVAKEGDIARDMILQGVLLEQFCINFDSNKDQRTYRVSLPESNKDGIDRMSFRTGYELRPVAGSNVFIILKKNTRRESTCCSNSRISPDSFPCTQSTCECLCFKEIKFDHCLNKFDSSDGSHPCAAKTPNIEGTVGDESQKIKTLPFCFDPKCCTRKNEEDCYNVAGCSWCMQNEKEVLSKPFCDLREVCMFGRLPGHKNCSDNCGGCDDTGQQTTTEHSPEPAKSDIGAIVGAVSGSLSAIIIVLVVFLVVCLCRKPRRNNHRRDTPIYFSNTTLAVDEPYDPKTKTTSHQKLYVKNHDPRDSHVYDVPVTSPETPQSFKPN